jgi:hypothetical protein
MNDLRDTHHGSMDVEPPANGAQHQPCYMPS